MFYSPLRPAQKLKALRMRRKYMTPLNPSIIAMCQRCGEFFSWLPPNFDMIHRFNRETHEWCGGQIEASDPDVYRGIQRAMEPQ